MDNYEKIRIFLDIFPKKAPLCSGAFYDVNNQPMGS